MMTGDEYVQLAREAARAGNNNVYKDDDKSSPPLNPKSNDFPSGSILESSFCLKELFLFSVFSYDFRARNS